MAAEPNPATNPGSPQTPDANRWPPQIKYIVGNEACERFSYYGMRSILAGYITSEVVKGGLGQTNDTATSIIHLFVFVNYFMPLLGGWLSDKIIGRYHTILWVSLFYCAGHGVLACSDFVGTVNGKMILLCVGLGLIAFGSGGIKPCVSAFMGDQFKPEQSHLLQKAYGAFYWSINLGSFFSFLVIPAIKNHRGYSLAFLVPGILMAIATFVFWLGTKYYTRVPPSRETKTAGLFDVFFAAYRQSTSPLAPLHNLITTIGLPLAAMIGLTFFSLSATITRTTTPLARYVGWISIVCAGLWYASVVISSMLRRLELPDSFWQGAARNGFNEKEINAARSVGPILFVFALIPVFFSLFDQTNSTWVLQGEKMVDFHFGQISLIQKLLPHWNLISFCVAPIVFTGLLSLIYRKKSSLSNETVFWLRIGAGVLSALLAGFVSILPHYTIGAEEMQSANPLLVMILVPIMTILLYPRIGKFASPLHRMSMGMFIAAGSYVVVALIQSRIEAGAQISVLWQFVPYTILTIAEVFVSTTGLEFAFREAAPEMKSLVMSFWLITIAFGDLLVAAITELFAGPTAGGSVSTSRFLLYAGLTFVVAILFSIVAAHYRYRDQAAAQGK
jgi:POT family proton-dependent oligopeptide transporter